MQLSRSRCYQRCEIDPVDETSVINYELGINYDLENSATVHVSVYDFHTFGNNILIEDRIRVSSVFSLQLHSPYAHRQLDQEGHTQFILTTRGRDYDQEPHQ